MTDEDLKKLRLPDQPGVYFFLKGRNILYIGKATSLKDRVKSYFGRDLAEIRGPLIVKMVQAMNKIDWQATDSVLEALILEANLIKKHQPYYNTREKDDKSFNYVCITGGKLPKVLIVRGKNVKGRVLNKVFGPYPNGSQLRETMKIIRRIFPFWDDKSKDHYQFYRQVDLAPDVSTGEGVRQYKNNIRHLKLFFRGRKKRIISNLKKEMMQAARGRKFERAGEMKKQIFALEHINDIALIKKDFVLRESASGLRKSAPLRLEAYDIAHLGGKDMVGVMAVVENGAMAKSEYRKFKIRTPTDSNDTAALAEVLERRLAHLEWSYPNLIVVDGGVAQVNAAKNALRKMRADIPVFSVVKNNRHQPKDILGDTSLALKHKSAILFGNAEAHRFAITYHKKVRLRNFLK